MKSSAAILETCFISRLSRDRIWEVFIAVSRAWQINEINNTNKINRINNGLIDLCKLGTGLIHGSALYLTKFKF